MLGKIVDERYRVVRLLGTGGMGTVYEAVHQGTGRRVALKVIANAELAADGGAIGRFQREAKAAGTVDTQHIAQVLDAGTDRATGIPYIAMEFLLGNDLRELSVTLGALDVHLALRIVGQACAGIQKAHDFGIVHRDIKPANLFLARQPDGGVIVKVLDFGIAKLPSKLLSGADALTATTTGRLLGSPLFMSPEQIRGLKTLDHRTDIWALGAVLYQTLAGQPPFAESETVGQLMFAICSQRPTPVDKVAPWVRPEAAAIVDRALRLEPEERYPTAEAMLADILALLPGGIDIDESQLMSASGKRLAQFGFKNEPTSVGTQSLDDNERFLVEPASPRADKPVESPARLLSPGDSDSTMPSANDRGRASDARFGRRRIVPSLVLLSAAAVLAIWWLRRPAAPTVQDEPAKAAVEPQVSAPKIELGVGGAAPDAIDPQKASVEAGAREPAVAERPARSSKDSKKKNPAGPSSVMALAAGASERAAEAPMTPPPVSAAMSVARPIAEPAPAVSASSAPPPQDSPWKLDRQFPARKASP